MYNYDFISYMGNNLSFLYDVFIIISLGYLRIMKTKKYNVTIDRSKKIYLIYFFIIILICTIMKFNDLGVILYFLRIMLLSLLCYRTIEIYGEAYIFSFFIGISKMMFILNIISILELVTKNQFLYNHLAAVKAEQVISTTSRLSSVFSHPIVYGNMLVITLAIILTLKNRFNKKYYFISIILIMVNLYYTQSRSSWIACICLIIMMIFLNLLSKKQITIKGILKKFLIVAVVLCSIFAFRQIINEAITNISYRFSFQDGSELSMNQRLGTMNNIMNNLMDNKSRILIGNGINSIHDFMLDHYVQIADFASADNQYLTFIYDLGLMFTIITIIYLFKCINIFD